ncbi:MAG: FxsA family protein [Acidimicrobiia bacterium]
MVFVVVALLLLPVVELAVIVQVGSWLGGWETIALLVMVTVVGVWIVKQQGIGAWSRIRGDLAAGRVPGTAIIDGALILTAGVLFLIPGFVTDIIAVVLLLPPVRVACRGALGRRFRVVAALHTASGPTAGRPDPAYDVESRVRPERHPRASPPELGA